MSHNQIESELQDANTQIVELKQLARAAVNAWYDQGLICTKEKPLKSWCSSASEKFPGPCDCVWPERNEPYRLLGLAVGIAFDDSKKVDGEWVKA